VTVTAVAEVAVQVAAFGSAPVVPEVQLTQAVPNKAYPLLQAVIVIVVPFTVQVLALEPQETAAVPLTPYPVYGVIQLVELQAAQLVPQAVQLPEAAPKMNPEAQLDKIVKDPPTKQLFEPVILADVEQLPYPHDEV